MDTTKHYSEDNWREEIDGLIREWAIEEGIVMEPPAPYASSPKYMDNPLVKKTFDFALNIIDFSEHLFEKKKFVVGQQLLKSGTGIASNSREAQNAESRADFVHKIKIALKEADETDFWLLVCNASKHYPNCDHLLIELSPILKILNKIVSTCKKYEGR